MNLAGDSPWEAWKPCAGNAGPCKIKYYQSLKQLPAGVSESCLKATHFSGWSCKWAKHTNSSEAPSENWRIFIPDIANSKHIG